MLVKNLESDFLLNIIAMRWSTKSELNNVVAVLAIGLRMKIDTDINDIIMKNWIHR